MMNEFSTSPENGSAVDSEIASPENRSITESDVVIPETRTFRVSGVPFSVTIGEDGRDKPLPHMEEIPVHQPPADFLYLCGPVTAEAPASDWWGPEEYWHNQSVRLYLGDYLGQLRIIYENNGLDCIPLLYGVTVWNYELHCQSQPHETALNTYGGPYPEPFASDPAAAALLGRSLLLNENPQGGKSSRFVLAVRLRPGLGVSRIQIFDGGKRNLPQIYAYTFGKGKCRFAKVTDSGFFLKKGYLNAVRALAHRLYQFREDIPENPVRESPAGRIAERSAEYFSDRPEVVFEGGRTARLLTNVFDFNLCDMYENKIGADGVPHTSSKTAPTFGGYVGDGCFRKNEGSYYSHCWSRDLGRTAIETVRAGLPAHMEKFVANIREYLYDDRNLYYFAAWKRICNHRQIGLPWNDWFAGKENDGHASMMLAVLAAFRAGVIGPEYVRENESFFADAVGYFRWQVDHPEKSNFDRVLSSESEAATQANSIPDLFSNVISCYALAGYQRMAERSRCLELAEECRTLRTVLEAGIEETFVSDTEPFGEVYHDTTYDCWTYDYKRFAALFLLPDLVGLEPNLLPERIEKRLRRSYAEQKTRFFNPRSGRQMGYGQGYLTQTALLLDETEDYSACIDACAEFCYHPDENYIVPEGVICHPTGEYWFRNGDLGNAVQQAEIVKSALLVAGVDTLAGDGSVRFVPRLPDSFDGVSLKRFRLAGRRSEGSYSIVCDASYRRIESGFKFTFEAGEAVPLSVRFGPFEPGGRIEVSGNVGDSAFVGPIECSEIAGRTYASVLLGSVMSAVLSAVRK